MSDLLLDMEHCEKIAVDTNKRFAYDKSTGKWDWFEAGDEENPNYWHGGFDTRWDAVQDAVEPYLDEEE